VSIRPGWFHHPAEDARVKTVDQLATLYFTSVGRNSKLLLNVPPTRDGLLHDVDVARLAGMHDRLTMTLKDDAANGRHMAWRATGAHAAVAEIDLGRTVTIGVASLAEDIAHGQVVAGYTLDGTDTGDWRSLSTGTTIGYRKLDRFAAAPVRRVRLTVEHVVDYTPRPVRVELYPGA
jgi:alpha-L-fucosidase